MQDAVDQRIPAGVKVTSKKPKTTSSSSADFETTFDVDGSVETIAAQQPPVDNQSVSVLNLL